MFRCIGLNWYIVISDHDQLVSIDGEDLLSSSSSVDQSKSVRFALSESELCEGRVVGAISCHVGVCAVETHFAVNEIVV